MTKKLKFTLLSIFLALLCASVAIPFLVSGENSSVYTFDDYAVKESYSVGEAASFPDVKMRNGANAFDTEFRLILPDGTGYAKRDVTFTTPGKYKIIYTGKDTAHSVTRITSKEFFVADVMYEITGTSTSAQPVYTDNTGYYNRAGIVANIMYGDVLYFKKSVNISGFSKNDKIISFFNVPTNLGSVDGVITVKITDANNQDNYIEVDFKKYSENSTPANTHTYISASFNGGESIGLRYHNGKNNGAGSVQYEGTWYQLDKTLGATVKYSLIGTHADGKEIGEDVLSVSYDEQTKQVLVNGTLISDLDQSEFYPSVFNGFSTGEVYVSVYGKNYSMDTVNPVITHLTQCDLSVNRLVDTEAPQIDVDLGGFSSDDVTAIKGQSFKLFEATATDKFTKDVKISAKVYKNYYASGRVFVSVTDGAFNPTSTAPHYIEYTAADNAGNVAKRVVKVNVIENRATALAVNITGQAASAKAGETVKIYQSAAVIGALGNAILSAEAVAPNGDKYPVDENDSFMPLSSGNYTVNVTYGDYIETKAHTFNLTVNGNDALVFFDKPITEKYLIKNAKYSFADFYATKFSENAPEKVKAEIRVSEDGGVTFNKVEGTYVVNATAPVKIKYVAINNGVEYVYPEELTIPVIDVNYGGEGGLNLSNYFQGERFAAALLDSRLEMTTDGSGSTTKAEFDFINQLQAERFSFTLGVKKSEAAFSKVNVYLTDAADAEKVIKLTYFMQDGKFFYKVNDSESKIALSVNYSDKLEDSENIVTFSSSYNNASKKIFGEIGNGVVVNKTLGGEPFEGFNSSLVYLTVEVEGLSTGKLAGEDKATVVIFDVNTQAFKAKDNRINGPQIIHSVGTGDVALGGTFTVNGSIVKDVLDPYITVSNFSVKAPNGSSANAIDGAVIDKAADFRRSYQVTAAEYGTYTVTLEVKNGANKKSKVVDYMYVIDVEAPVLTVDTANEEIKLGKAFTVRTASITDNKSTAETCSINVLIEQPSGYMSVTTMGAQVTLDKAGVYTVRYMAYDENGNVAYAQYSVTVK